MNNKKSPTALQNSVGLEELYQIVQEKSSSNDLHSYTKKLTDSKINLVAQKIGEEGVEVAISALDHDRFQTPETRQEIINEVADLFYHTLAMLVKFDIKIDEIYSELHKRNSQHDKH